jgi:cytochrome c oxidase subunit 2
MPIPGIGPQASSIAGAYDTLFWFLLIGCTVIAGIVTIALITFAIRYRRRSEDEVPVQTEGALKLELAWTFVPLVLAIGVFLWSAVLYVRMSRPEDATRDLEIFVTGRQWMWKAQQPTGQWENNELHVPINRPVTLNMTSIDVIHSFGVPAFRLRQDVVPGRYTTLSFTATQPGVYPIYCSEYCGAFHSGMVGRVTAMEPRAYEAWLAGPTTMESPAAAGQRLAQNLGCITCHQDDNRGQGPSWVGLFGTQEELSDGSTVTVDEAYIRESILFPSRKLVAGHEDRMPTYQGQVDETQLLQLIAYIKSLGGVDQQQPGGSQEIPSTDATPGLEPNPGIGTGAQDEP